MLRFARENPSWGYDKIQGALANLGHRVSDTTVANILKEHGIEPAGERKRQTTWKTFIKAHWDVLAAIDFTTIEVWTTGGLVTYYLLFVMEVATRRVHFAGCTTNPHTAWMKQMAREGVNPVPLPARSPNLNAHLERFFGSLKSEALVRMIFFGENALRRAVNAYLHHYHEERNHQGLGNQIIDPGDEVGRVHGDVQCRERLGGLLRYYHRDAA